MLKTATPATRSTATSSAPPRILQRACACGNHTMAGGECAHCARKKRSAALFRQSSTAANVSEVPSIVHQVLASPGTALDADTRAFMEPRFGKDFAGVRIHTDAAAAASARAVHASAYTVGEHVVFAPGQYRPHTEQGRQLLAHELAHVVQQDGKAAQGELMIAGETSAAESEAAAIGARVAAMPDDVAPVSIRRFTRPALLRKTDFSSPIEICHRLLTSRRFHVSQGGLVVTAKTRWEASDSWQGSYGGPACGRDLYNMTLNRVDDYFDDTVATCEFKNGASMSRNYTNLPEGDYYLEIFTNNTNPNCCLRGEISVTEVQGLEGEHCSGGYIRDIATMMWPEKVGKAMTRSLDKLPGEVGNRLKEMLTPEAIALMGLFASAYVISQITPVGWIADIIVAGLLVATVLMLGHEVVAIVRLLIDFFDKAQNAKSEADIDEAAELFAMAVSKAGIDIIMAIIFHKAGKAADLKPPGPRSPGLVEVLTVQGNKLKVEIGKLEPAGFEPVMANGAPMPVEQPIVFMVEAAKPGGKTGSQLTGKGSPTKTGTGKPTDAEPLPGKELIAAEGVVKDPRKPTAAADPLAPPKHKETGAQQETRLMKEDRSSRSERSKTYFDYEGKNRGSFNEWFSRLKSHVDKKFKGDPNKPALNEAPLAEDTIGFIERHHDLRVAWDNLRLPLEKRLNDIRRWKEAAGTDKRRIRELEKMEQAVEVERQALADFEKGTVGSKRPDLVEVFFDQNGALVTDITQQTGDALHSFKTEFYVQVLKDVLGYSKVEGFNFNTVFDVTFTQ